MRHRADELKRGDEIELDGQDWIVEQVRVTPVLAIICVAPGWWITLDRDYIIRPARRLVFA